MHSHLTSSTNKALWNPSHEGLVDDPTLKRCHGSLKMLVQLAIIRDEYLTLEV